MHNKIITLFKEHPMENIKDGFLTLQACIHFIIKHHGGNHYKIPHMNKEKLRREFRMPLSLVVAKMVMQFNALEDLVNESSTEKKD